MPLSPDLFNGVPERYGRFERFFLAQDTLGDQVNEILDHHKDKLKIRSHNDDEHDLSLMAATAFGKGIKTFRAITQLCLLGYGEDALVLLRSNVNLLINISYILSSENPIERAKELLAYSHEERAKYLKLAHNIENPPWTLKMSSEEADRRARSWREIRIVDKAKVIHDFHYTQGYRFYSSFEHSDAFALNDYVDDWNEIGPFIGAGPSDKHIGIALVHSYGVLADLLVAVCKYFGIDRPDVAKTLADTWGKLSNK